MTDCIESRSTIFWHRDIDTCRWFVAVSIVSYTTVCSHWTDADSATWVKSVIRPAVWSARAICCSRITPTDIVVICTTYLCIFHAVKMLAFQLPFIYFRISQLWLCATYAAFIRSYSMTYVLMLLHRKSRCVVYYFWSLPLISRLQET